MTSAGRDRRDVLSRPAAPPDAVLRYGGHPDQVIDLRLPRRPAAAPLVVVVHGGFWRPEYDRGHAGPQSVALAAAGYVVATLEYRRAGAPVLLGDVETALDALHGLVEEAAPGRADLSRTVLVGHSAGGHLVLWVAGRRPAPAGVVALAAVCDLVAAERDGLGGGAVRDLLGGPAAEHPDLDPARRQATGVPTVLVHGEEDDVVPVEQSRGYARGRPDVVLDVVPGADHFAVIDPESPAWPRVLAAVGRVAGTVTTLA